LVDAINDDEKCLDRVFGEGVGSSYNWLKSYGASFGSVGITFYGDPDVVAFVGPLGFVVIVVLAVSKRYVESVGRRYYVPTQTLLS
jgi:hypothetical protein